MTLSRRHVLITGASTGIGEASTLLLAAHGFQVFAAVRRESDGEALVTQGGAAIVPVILDVTRQETIDAALAHIEATLAGEGLWGLVNNAGIAVGGPLEFVPIEDLRQQLEVNVIGQVAVTQAFLPLLRKARGRIVNMGSVSGRIVSPFLGPYAASKWALEALTAAMRTELYPWGIQTTIINPANFKTPIWKKSGNAIRRMIDKMPPRAFELYGNLLEMLDKRLEQAENTAGPVSEVAEAVLHALNAETPKRRYPLGRSAHMVEWLRHLPELWLERRVLKALYRRRYPTR